MKASELGVPTFEAEVSCGPYCYGGRIATEPTSGAEYTDASEVWVRGGDVAKLAARLAEAEAHVRWLLPMARGWAHEHPVGRNQAFCNDAVAFLEGTADSASGDQS